MSNPINRCISCQSDKIRKKRGAFPVTKHGKTVNVPGIERYTCSQCGETFLDLDNETKIDNYLAQRETRPLSTSLP